MSRRQSDGSVEAAGCAFGLIVMAIFGVIWILGEALRYRPAPYAPYAPEYPSAAAVPRQKKEDWQIQLAVLKWALWGLAGLGLASFVYFTLVRGALGLQILSVLLVRRELAVSGWVSAVEYLVVNSLGVAWGIGAGLVGLNVTVFADRIGRCSPLSQGEARGIWIRSIHLGILQKSLVLGLALFMWLGMGTSGWVVHILQPSSAVVELGVIVVGMGLTGLLAVGLVLLFSEQRVLARLAEAQNKAETQAKVARDQFLEVLAERQRRDRAARRCYHIYPPKGKAEYVRGSKLMQSLLTVCPRLTFQIQATDEQVAWQVVDSYGQYQPEKIQQLIQTHLPGTMVVATASSETEDTIAASYRQHIVFRLGNEFVAPLPFLESLKAYDPLTALVEQMGQLGSGERLVYSVMVLTASGLAKQRALERYTGGYVQPLADIRIPNSQGEYSKTGLDEHLIKLKLAGSLYHCFVVITTEAPTQNRVGEMATVAQEIGHFNVPGHNMLVPAAQFPIETMTTASWEAVITDLERYLVSHVSIVWRDWLLVLAPAEIAALWHVAHEEFHTPRIAWAGTPIPDILMQAGTNRVVIGHATTPGQDKNVGILRQDRVYHHHMLGKTGMGKSTLLLNLILQDIQAGYGVAVIDPQGALVNDILPRLEVRQEDVVLLECGRTDFPVPLNPFRVLPGMSFHQTRRNLKNALELLYSDIVQYPGVQRTLDVLLNALLCDPEATLLDVRRVFWDRAYRTRLIQQVLASEYSTQQVVDNLRDYDQLSRSELERKADPILTRTAALISNRALEHMLCHPLTIHTTRLIKERKIVLMNLAGDAVADEIGSLSTLFLTSFFNGCQSLGVQADGAPPRYYLYIDEAHRVMSPAVVSMLAEVRKYGLSLTLTHQFLDQLKPEAVKGVLGNVGTLFTFAIGDEDAGKLMRYYEPEVTRDVLVKLGAFRVAVRTQAAGQVLPTFIAQTYDKPGAGSNATEQIREANYAEYGVMTAKAVRAWLDKRYNPAVALETDNGNGRAPDSSSRPELEAIGATSLASDVQLRDFE